MAKGILQTLGNLTDVAGTTAAKIGNAPIIKNLPQGRILQELGKERGISENFAQNKPTVNTGVTQESRAFGFTPYTPANMSNKSSGLTVTANRQKQPMLGLAPQNKSIGNSGGDTGGNAGGNKGGLIDGGSGSSQSAQDAEQEKTNESFRQQLGNEYADLRNKFGSQVGDITNLLNTLPGQIKQLGSEYKTAIGEKQRADIAGVQSNRERVQGQQKEGLQSVAENVAQTMRDVSGRLANVGAGSSSAVNFFSRAIQKAGNENTRKILQQAANNYSELDNQENKIKSNYKTLLDKLDREEQSNIQNIQNDVPNIINKINEGLKKSGEYETLDKQGLTDKYLASLTPLFEEAKSNSDYYRKKLESWRMDNQNKIADLRNQIVQEFTPKDITYSKLPGAEMSDMTPSQDNTLNPIDIRRRRQEEELSNPEGLSNIVKKLRDQQMQ